MPQPQLWRMFHERLRELDIAVLEVRPPFTQHDLCGFIAALASRGDPESVITALNAAAPGKLAATPIDFSRLSAAGEGTAGEPLEALIASMVHGDAAARAVAISQRCGPGSEGKFAADFARTAQWIESLPSSEQDAALKNVRPLLATLDGRFRERLLSPGNTDAPTWRVLANLSDAIPVTDVQHSLRSLSDKPAQLSVEATAIFAKLASSLTPDAPEAATATAVRNVACEVLCVEESGLADRLESVLKVHSSDDFSPTDYRDRIITLATSSVASTAGTAGPGDFSAAAVQAHLARTIASIALLRPRHPGVMDALTAQAESVLVQEGPGSLLEAASLCLPEHPLRSLVCSPPFVLKAVGHPDCSELDMELLLQGCGPQSLGDFLRQLASEPSRAARAAVLCMFARLPEPDLASALRNAGSAEAAYAALTLVPALDHARGTTVCRELLSHADGPVRAEAFRTMADLQEVTDDAFLSALSGRDDAVAQIAVQCLQAQRRGPQVLASALMERATPDARFDLLAHALTDEGSLDTAAGVLVGLTSRASGTHAPLADRLAAHLRPHKSHPAVGRALRRYRFSLSRFLAFIFPGSEDQGTTGRSAA